MVLPYEIERTIMEFLGVRNFKRCRSVTSNKILCKKKNMKGYFMCAIHQKILNKRIEFSGNHNMGNTIGELSIMMHYVIHKYYNVTRFSRARMYIEEEYSEKNMKKQCKFNTMKSIKSIQ